jgi:hypothetical protein
MSAEGSKPAPWTVIEVVGGPLPGATEAVTAALAARDDSSIAAAIAANTHAFFMMPPTSKGRVFDNYLPPNEFRMCDGLCVVNAIGIDLRRVGVARSSRGPRCGAIYPSRHRLDFTYQVEEKRWALARHMP